MKTTRFRIRDYLPWFLVLRVLLSSSFGSFLLTRRRRGSRDLCLLLSHAFCFLRLPHGLLFLLCCSLLFFPLFVLRPLLFFLLSPLLLTLGLFLGCLGRVIFGLLSLVTLLSLLSLLGLLGLFGLFGLLLLLFLLLFFLGRVHNGLGRSRCSLLRDLVRQFLSTSHELLDSCSWHTLLLLAPGSQLSRLPFGRAAHEILALLVHISAFHQELVLRSLLPHDP
mmetsp:Transcript_15675/g.35654  ORF Transcript_15675/g.35654 Transcript_15675/m.35654 type:complete len:222 (-) Transcript_15675:56-721(-)